MRRLFAGAAVAAALLVPTAGLADAPAPHVSIEFGDYSPATIAVVAGDTVDWTNVSQRNHTVTDDAGGWDSDVVYPGDSFDQRFDVAGRFTYHCRLHPYIRGEVDVYDVLLNRPPAPASADQPFPLDGRADLPANTPVTIEADTGAGFQAVSKATVGPSGSFTAIVKPSATGRYRAVAGAQASPAVPLLVLNHTIAARAKLGRHRTVVSVQVMPADPGGTVVLQLHLRERFGWWPVAQLRLDKRSRARFVVHPGRRVSARAVLTLPDGATPLASSSLVRVR